MDICCLDADPALAERIGALHVNDLADALALVRPEEDALLVNVGAPDNLLGTGTLSQWESKWTRIVADARREFAGPILVVDLAEVETAATRLTEAVSQPGLDPFREGLAPGELVDAWLQAGVAILRDPFDRQTAEEVIASARKADPDRIAAVRLRLALIHAFKGMRHAWHRDENRAAALRVLGGAVLAWLDDQHAGRKQPRGIAPSVAAQALSSWRNGLDASEATEPTREALKVLIAILDDLIAAQPDAEPTRRIQKPAGQAILIDDEAWNAGWGWVLRALLRDRFSVHLPNDNVVTRFDDAVTRLEDKEGKWLDGKHLVFLDLIFPEAKRGGLDLLDLIANSGTPVPVILFSAETLGPPVRHALEHGAHDYYFKQYGDDRPAIDYYLALEGMISRALSKMPRLIAGQRWSSVKSVASEPLLSCLEEGERWVQQGLSVFASAWVGANAPKNCDIAVLWPGIALEQMIYKAVRAPQSAFSSESLNEARAMTMFINPTGQVPQYNGQGLRGFQKMRYACGMLLRDMRNGIAHAYLPPERFDDIDALVAYLAAAYFLIGPQESQGAERLYRPLREKLFASPASSRLDKGLFGRQAAKAAIQRVKEEWTKETGETISKVTTIAFNGLGGPARAGPRPARFSHLVYCAILSRPLGEWDNAQSRLDDRDASMIAELCSYRIHEILDR